MKIIITGATGFIGCALCEEFLRHGDDVVAVVRPGTAKKEKLLRLKENKPENTGSLQIAELELENLEQLATGYQVQADVFYHLAWNGSSGADRENFEIQLSNVHYTGAAIRAAKLCGCQAFIGAGSQAEYGVIRETAKEGKTLPDPFMMYGAAKLAACSMGKLLAKQQGIRFLWPRIYSVYGVGENPGTLINYVMESLLQGQVPELSPCENMWNFLYITDCCKLLRMLGSVSEEGIYHIASKDTRLLKEFVCELRDTVAPGTELGFGKKTANPDRTFWLEPEVNRLTLNRYVEFREGILKKMKSFEKN